MGLKRKVPVPPPPQKDKNPELSHESFLQAFEKPTQIYRYLRTRNAVLPTFLARNLSYMVHRRTGSNKKRKSFKVDSLLGTIEARHKKRSECSSRSKQETLKLSFEGFHIAEFATESDFADVEIYQAKVCQKRRKDASLPIMSNCLGKIKVPVNPKLSSHHHHHEVTIPSNNFIFKNGHVVLSHLLHFQVKCTTLKEASDDNKNSPYEPPLKRRRNGRISSLEEETLIFSRELTVYDKNRQKILLPGEYELGVETADGSEKMKLNTVWESFNGLNVRPLELFSDYPTLKFNVSWMDESNGIKPEKILNTLSRVPPSGGLGDVDSDFSTAFETWLKSEYVNGCPATGKRKQAAVNGEETPSKRMRVFYQFSHAGCTQQETEARQDLCCPWCGLACGQLYSLLKHLRLCHSRFNFLYIPHPKGARIDVSINNRFDGSYVGNPQDIHSHVGLAFSRSDPVRRTPVTHVIVYRPKRPPPSLAEFQEPETDTVIVNRQFIQGHNRLYYHAGTCQPVRPQELDNEGDEEAKPKWLQEKTVMMIDEFTDVNEGEKEVMKVWNLHIMKKEYIGDCMMPKACQTFVAEHGRKIIEKNLCRNFLLHLVNLNDFGLIKPEVVQKTYTALFNMKIELEEKGDS